MSGEIEAAGDLITGAAIAHAVEPGAGAAGEPVGSCLNCGAKLTAAYCQICGQKADVHRTLGAFWHDFTHSILHFEGKIWRTLPLLALKPGELTRRYVDGERARFVSPLALFLFSIFLMFAVFSWVGPPMVPDPVVTKDGAVQAQADIARDLAAAKAKIVTLEAARSDAVRAGTPVAQLDLELNQLRRDVRGYDLAQRIARDGLSGGNFKIDEAHVNTGSPELDERVRGAVRNPQLLLYKMQSNAYKFSWAVVLLSLPFMWLIFAWKRRFHLFDHLVFVTYSLCFVTLLLISFSLLTAIGLGGIIGLLLVLIVPVHLFAQLRGAYTLSVPSALWRTAFLLVAAVIVVLLFALLLLAVGVS